MDILRQLDLTNHAATGTPSTCRFPALLPKPRASHGLSALLGQRLAVWFRSGRKHCKTVVANRLKGCGMRWGHDWLRRRLPPPCPLPQPARTVGILLEKLPKLTTIVTLTPTAREMLLATNSVPRVGRSIRPIDPHVRREAHRVDPHERKPGGVGGRGGRGGVVHVRCSR